MAGKKIQELSFTKLELRIVKFIFRHYQDRYTPRALARELGLNHAHINNICALLQKKGLLMKEDIGISDYYRFNYKDSLATKFMEYLISLELIEFPVWLQVPLHSLRQFDDDIDFGCIFGSSIRGEEFNDIDILLVYDKAKSRMIEKTKAAIRNSELVEKPIRYVDLTLDDLRKNKDDKVLYSMISDSLVFCHAEKFVGVIQDVAN